MRLSFIAMFLTLFSLSASGDEPPTIATKPYVDSAIIHAKGYADAGLADKVAKAAFDAFQNRSDGFATAAQGTKADNAATAAALSAHAGDTGNPHSVTKAQVGLGNADNTADANKSVASAAKLTTARKITLAGSVQGSGTFDGSGNLTINTIGGSIGGAPFDEISTSMGADIPADHVLLIGDGVDAMASSSNLSAKYGFIGDVFISRGGTTSYMYVAHKYVAAYQAYNNYTASTMSIIGGDDVKAGWYKYNDKYYPGIHKVSGSIFSVLLKALLWTSKKTQNVPFANVTAVMESS